MQRVAVRLRTRFGLEVDGVDLLEFNLRRARRKAARLGLGASLRFHRLDDADPPFPDRTFNGASPGLALQRLSARRPAG